MRGKSGTGPTGMFESSRNLKQVITRLHRNDHAALQPLLKKDGIAFQHFVTACVESYLRRDPDVLRLIKEWRDVNHVRWKDENKFDFSDRERRAMLEELSLDFDDADEDKE